MVWLVTRNLLADIAPRRVTITEWHLRGAIWTALLPRRLGPEKLFLLYCHYLPFEDGHGLTYGSEKYFQTKPADLTTDQALVLLVISRSPRAHSPSRHPERFQQAMSWYRARYKK
jgi:membrane carboxypeptidase/penicillin-binding protein PbpC